MDPGVSKVAIGSAVLASVLGDFGASAGDCDGVLFGRVERVARQALEDEGQGAGGSPEELTALVTGHFCGGAAAMSFYDATGRVDAAALARIAGNRARRNGDPPIGWFAGRRNTPFRPSMRESAVSRYLSMESFPLPRTADFRSQKGASADLNRFSPQHGGSTLLEMAGSPHQLDLRTGPGTEKGSPSAPDSPSRAIQRSPLQSDKSYKSGLRASSSPDSTPSKFEGSAPSSPCIFLLLTESGLTQAIHTHDYRAYQYRSAGQGSFFFEPRTISIVNLGPAFRMHYDVFRPVAPFPLLATASSLHQNQSVDMADSWSSSIETRMIRRGTQERRRPDNSLSKEQIQLDVYCDSYNVEKLASLIGGEGTRRVTEVEDLYCKMLSKLDTLAKQVSQTSAALLEQESFNAKLREGFMGD